MMPEPALQVRQGLPSDAARLAAFAARTFSEAFGADNRPEDLAAYLAASYGPTQQGRELADPTYRTFIVEADGELAGYAQLRHGRPPPCVAGPAPIELYRFYVDRIWHGRGVAQRLMREVHAGAAELGGQTLWLSTWERNPRGRAFYAKCGFLDVGTTEFHVGTDRQIDRVLMTAVDAEARPTS